MNQNIHFPSGAGGYRIDDQQGVYFLTFTVVGWVDVFVRSAYKQLVMDALRFYQDKDGLQVYAFVLMTNHMHLIVRSPN